LGYVGYDDIKPDENINIIKQELKKGPRSFKQRVYDFTSKTFGNHTDSVIINDIIGYLTNMTLRIELAALTSTDSNTGYLNWVDGIGYAIIESITFEIAGQKIFDNTFEYGLWLDIYNELNDPDMLEWGLVGKHSSTQSLKKYANSVKVLYVPLHFWFSKNLESAFPLFLLDNAEINISIKLRNSTELYVTNVAETPTPTINSLSLIVDYIDMTNDTKPTEDYNLYFKYYRHEKKILSGLVNLKFVQSLISKIIFVNRAQTRSRTSSKLINEHYSDTNGNDIFNYGNTSEISALGTIDTFEKLFIRKPNGDETEDFDAVYYRKVANMFSNKIVPQKHIYTIPFNYDNRDNYITGLIEKDGTEDITLEFETPAPSFDLHAFAETYRKLSIVNNTLIFDNWSGTTAGAGAGAGDESENESTNKYITLLLYIDDIDFAFQGIPSFVKNKCNNTSFCLRKEVGKNTDPTVTAQYYSVTENPSVTKQFDNLPGTTLSECLPLENQRSTYKREYKYYPYLALRIEQDGKPYGEGEEKNKTTIKIIGEEDWVSTDSTITKDQLKEGFKNLYQQLYDEHNDAPTVRNICRNEEIKKKISDNIANQQTKMDNLNNFNKLKIAYINNINLENIPGWQTSTTKDPLLGQIFRDNIEEYKISIESLKNIENFSGDLSLDLKYYSLYNKFSLHTRTIQNQDQNQNRLG
jgi:hypothetical protein